MVRPRTRRTLGQKNDREEQRAGFHFDERCDRLVLSIIGVVEGVDATGIADHGHSPNTVELAVRYVRTGLPIYSPLRRGDTGGFLAEAIPRASAGKSPPPTPPSQGGDEFAISTATVGYS